jgi:hypothetical protein
LIPSKAILIHSGTSMLNFLLASSITSIFLNGNILKPSLSINNILRFSFYGLLFYGPAGIRTRKTIVDFVGESGATGVFKMVFNIAFSDS